MKREIVLLGSLIACSGLAAQGWVDVSNPNNNPGPRVKAAMAYDEARGYCLLSFGDTWKFDGVTWTQLFPANQPVAVGRPFTLRESTAVYDSWRNKVVMINGGWDNSGQVAGYASATYEWDGQDWAQLDYSYSNYTIWSAFYYSWRSANVMAFDRMRGETVRFCAVPSQFGTYTRTSGAWALRSPLVSTPVTWNNFASALTADLRMFYDEARQRVVLVCSNPASYWEWDGAVGNWSQIFPSFIGAPISNGSFGPIAYQPNRNIGIGLGVDDPYTTNTLQYGGGQISRPRGTHQNRPVRVTSNPASWCSQTNAV